jgi:histidinol-phosphate aminotransferase
VFIDTRKPYAEVQKKFETAGILIGREFTPYNTWVRISIGLPEENRKAQEVIRKISDH